MPKAKTRKKEVLTGGLADNRPDSDFDPEQLRAGMATEKEHTSDPEKQKEIAKDHLTEDPQYYIKLKKIEKAARLPVENGLHPGTIVLLPDGRFAIAVTPQRMKAASGLTKAEGAVSKAWKFVVPGVNGQREFVTESKWEEPPEFTGGNVGVVLKAAQREVLRQKVGRTRPAPRILAEEKAGPVRRIVDFTRSLLKADDGTGGTKKKIEGRIVKAGTISATVGGRAVQFRVAGINLGDGLEKAREGLVAKKVTVSRKGKTFQATRWVRPGELLQSASGSKDLSAEDDYRTNGVRSKAFKSWFGDWENNPGASSKVVDHKTGKPKGTHGPIVKVYHGTQRKFSEFSKQEQEGVAVGKGFYFAEDKRVADTYTNAYPGLGTGRIIEAYLNIRNPFDFGRRFTAEEAAKIDPGMKSEGAGSGSALWEKLSKKHGNGKVNDVLQKAGFDGIVHRTLDRLGSPETDENKPGSFGSEGDYGRIWIAFEPGQIKSVENTGTFDPGSNDIMKAEPTEAQKEAGNYKKDHVSVQGLSIAIENPKGSYRSGTDADGSSWRTKMHCDYGYIKRTEGADGDHVDVFIGPDRESEIVFVVDQVKPKTGEFDEHKVMMGFSNETEARKGYLANYESGWKGLGMISPMTMGQFKVWLQQGQTGMPVAYDGEGKEFLRASLGGKLFSFLKARPHKYIRKEGSGPTARYFYLDARGKEYEGDASGNKIGGGAAQPSSGVQKQPAQQSKTEPAKEKGKETGKEKPASPMDKEKRKRIIGVMKNALKTVFETIMETYKGGQAEDKAAAGVQQAGSELKSGRTSASGQQQTGGEPAPKPDKNGTKKPDNEQKRETKIEKKPNVKVK